MATQLFLLDTVPDTHLATNNVQVNGIAPSTGWQGRALGTARGSGVVATANMNTSNGPLAGIEVGTVSSNAIEWISPPVSADVTIAGTITGNVWASETNMSANVSICILVEVIRANALGTVNSNTLVEIARRGPGTEIAVTTRAVNNYTVTPTSTVVNRGDRLRIRVFGDDISGGNMATGYTFNASYNGTSAAADGDTYVTFTENFSFESAPGGSTLYLTNTASAVVTANTDLEAWTSRGSSATVANALTTTGWIAPIQERFSGASVDWFSRPLSAFTLTGMAVANLWVAEGSASANASIRCEIARVDGDGTNATVWASWCIAPTGTDNGEITTAYVARTANVSGDDLAVTDGQRLRIRAYIDDMSSAPTGNAYGIDVRFNGPTPAASGDTYITLPQVVTEYASGPYTYTKAGYGKESA